MSFWCPPFPPKNEQKQVYLRFHSSKVEFIRSFFGGNVYLKKSFRLFLTFSKSKQNLISMFFRKKQVRSWQLFVRVIPRRLTDQKDTQINWSPLVGAAVVLHPHQRPPQLRVASNQTTLSPEWGYFSKEAQLRNPDPIHHNLKGGKIG